MNQLRMRTCPRYDESILRFPLYVPNNGWFFVDIDCHFSKAETIQTRVKLTVGSQGRIILVLS
jgi:hypothetical protein